MFDCMILRVSNQTPIFFLFEHAKKQFSINWRSVWHRFHQDQKLQDHRHIDVAWYLCNTQYFPNFTSDFITDHCLRCKMSIFWIYRQFAPTQSPVGHNISSETVFVRNILHMRRWDPLYCIEFSHFKYRRKRPLHSCLQYKILFNWLMLLLLLK